MTTINRFKSDQNPDELNGFTGTEQYYKDPTMDSFVYTDGVKHVFDTYECRWLGVEISMAYVRKDMREESFITCELFVNEDSSATITFTDGNNEVLYVKEIEWTDFPLKGICLWLVNSVLILPTEY